MADVIEMRIEGGEELLRRLREMGFSVEDVLLTAATAGAEVIAAEANTMAPEPKIEVAPADGNRRGEISVDVGPPEDKWYWRFLETGAQPHEITAHKGLLVFEGEQGLVRTGKVHHSGIAARPFLRPALDERQDDATDEVGKHICEVIEK